MTDHAASTTAPEPAADPLLKQFADASDGLFIMSETDSPLTPFRWPRFFAEKSAGEDTTAALRAVRNLPSDVVVEKITLEKFFKTQIEPAEGDDDEIAEEKKRLTALRDLLAKALENVTVYRTGTINITAYVLGRVPDTTDGAGVSAELVET